jgi:hypothetical protein
MSRQEATRYHFVPQAILKQSPAFFAAKGLCFHAGHDDLDEFEVAELSLDEKRPFALLIYRGTPEYETMVFPPNRFSTQEIPALIGDIVSAFGLAAAAVTWQRSRTDTPY